MSLDLLPPTDSTPASARSTRPAATADVLTADELARLGAEVAHRGIDHLGRDVLRVLASRARLAGVTSEVVALLTDTASPVVVRNRAFGLIARRLAQPMADPTPVDDPRLAA